MKRGVIYLLTVANLIGLAYLLGIGWYSLIAHDDYAFLGNLNRFGYAGALKHWYFHWQGRFAPHCLIQLALILYKHNIKLEAYYVFITLLGIYGLYALFKNAARLKQIQVDTFLALNVACFVFILSVYNNFEMNTFYWLNASTMYVGGVVCFIIGFAWILSSSNTWPAYLVIVLSFLYAGASSENFSAIVILILSLTLFSIYITKYRPGLNMMAGDKHAQKIFLALVCCFIPFVIMVCAPGNLIRLAATNEAYKGYEKVPVPLPRLPGKVLMSYISILVNVISRAPLLLAAAPVFMSAGASLGPFSGKKPITRLASVFVIFFVALAFFIVPTVYAQASPGADRSYTYLSFFITLLAFYIFMVLGNMRLLPGTALSLMSVLSLLFFCGIYIRDIRVQIPGVKKYALSEKSRLQKIECLKKAGNTGVVVLDSLYTPKYISRSNVLRNEIKDKLKKHTPFRESYSGAAFTPLEYNEISADTAFYLSSDMAKTLNLPFAICVKK